MGANSSSRSSSDDVFEEIMNVKFIEYLKKVFDGCVILVFKVRDDDIEIEVKVLVVVAWFGCGKKGKSISVLVSKASGG